MTSRWLPSTPGCRLAASWPRGEPQSPPSFGAHGSEPRWSGCRTPSSRPGAGFAVICGSSMSWRAALRGPCWWTSRTAPTTAGRRRGHALWGLPPLALAGYPPLPEPGEGPRNPRTVLPGSCAVRAQVAPLSAGADDCFAKPLDAADLLARLRAVLRRAGGVGTASRVGIGSRIVDLARRTVTAPQGEV